MRNHSDETMPMHCCSDCLGDSVTTTGHWYPIMLQFTSTSNSIASLLLHIWRAIWCDTTRGQKWSHTGCL